MFAIKNGKGIHLLTQFSSKQRSFLFLSFFNEFKATLDSCE